MRQPPLSALSHASPASSHASVVQASVSLQSREAPAHEAPAVHISDTVQKRPSLHAAPVRGVHAVVLAPGEQSWHGVPGSSSAEA